MTRNTLIIQERNYEQKYQASLHYGLTRDAQKYLIKLGEVRARLARLADKK